MDAARGAESKLTFKRMRLAVKKIVLATLGVAATGDQGPELR
jgi:nicotinamide mononucleotide (NMN) deamidase PncC